MYTDWELEVKDLKLRIIPVLFQFIESAFEDGFCGNVEKFEDLVGNFQEIGELAECADLSQSKPWGRRIATDAHLQQDMEIEYVQIVNMIHQPVRRIGASDIELEGQIGMQTKFMGQSETFHF